MTRKVKEHFQFSSLQSIITFSIEMKYTNFHPLFQRTQATVSF